MGTKAGLLCWCQLTAAVLAGKEFDEQADAAGAKSQGSPFEAALLASERLVSAVYDMQF